MDQNIVCVFDTTITDNNLGNQIIMESVRRYLNYSFGQSFFIDLPCLDPLGEQSQEYLRSADVSFLGGTNALSSAMDEYTQWSIKKEDVCSQGNVVLLGVGWWQYQHDVNAYTSDLLKAVLASDRLHSLRDNYAIQKLKHIGFRNVLNTGCPTMWCLSEAACEQLPTHKSEEVLVTFTNYRQNISQDLDVIKVLRRNYDVIHAWVQGPEDYLYIKELCPEANILAPNLESLRTLLLRKNIELDYVGTRLHAGIFSMQHGRRSIILGVDNRAIEKAKDFNLPVVLREQVDKLEQVIRSTMYTRLQIPERPIELWMNQFLQETKSLESILLESRKFSAALPLEDELYGVYESEYEKQIKPSASGSNAKGREIVAGALSTEPVSRLFGFDRGVPIDRVWMENFMESNRKYIQGRVMEIADNEYTMRFGSEVTQSEIMAPVSMPNVTRVGNLETGENVPKGSYDCIILTQTIHVIEDFTAAMRNALDALAPGGTLLLTAPGISQISRYDMDRWGDFWRFTDKSLRNALEKFLPEGDIEVSTAGNVGTAKAFLDGLAAHEVPANLFTYVDPDYQVLVMARVTKPLLQEDNWPPKRQRGQKPRTLIYHRVNRDSVNSQMLAVSPKNFSEQLAYLSEHCSVVPLAEHLATALEGKASPDSVSITFDDGYADNLLYALPILEKFGLHATVFVTAGTVGSNGEFWWDALERILLLPNNLPERLIYSSSDGSIHEWNMVTLQGRKNAHEALCETLRNMTFDDAQNTVASLLEWAGIPSTARESHRTLTQEELRKLDASPCIEIGSHCVGHGRLSVLSPEEQFREMKQAKEALEAMLDHEVRLVSYPFGTVHDITDETPQLARQCGYAFGIANNSGDLSSEMEPYATPRRLVRDWDGERFALWMHGGEEGIAEHEAALETKLNLIKTLGGRGKGFDRRKRRSGLKILHVNTWNTSGGAANVAEGLAKMQRAEGHSVHMLVGQRKEDCPFTHELLTTQHELNKYCQAGGLLDLGLDASLRLVEQEIVNEADIIHLHNLHGHYFNPLAIVALATFRPVVWTLHDMQGFTGHCAHSFDCSKWSESCYKCPYLSVSPALPIDSSWLNLRLKRSAFSKLPLHIVTPSLWLKQKVEKSVLKNSPLRSIPNFVDVDVFTPERRKAARETLGVTDDTLIFGAVAHGGAMQNPWKGGEYMAAAVKAVQDKFPDALFLDIGGGSYSRNGQCINFPYVKEPEELAGLYAAMDVFVHTATAENCPLVVLEAMACGTPVVSFATGGIPELVRDGKEGFIVPYLDGVTLNRALKELLAHRTLRATMGQAAAKRVREHYSVSMAYGRYSELYEEILGQLPLEDQKGKVFPNLDLIPEIQGYCSSVLSALSASKF